MERGEAGTASNRRAGKDARAWGGRSSRKYNYYINTIMIKFQRYFESTGFGKKTVIFAWFCTLFLPLLLILKHFLASFLVFAFLGPLWPWIKVKSIIIQSFKAIFGS